MLKNPWVQGAVLVVLLILYILTKQQFFGILAAIVIFAAVALEVKEGAHEHGWKHELADTAKALVIALLLWFGAGFLLHTPSPLSAVASCSMLPNLQRGDFVVVQGGEINAPEIALSQAEYNDFLGKARIVYNGEEKEVRGSMISYCSASTDPWCTLFYRQPNPFIEQRGPLTFRYSTCLVQTGSREDQETPCTQSIEYDGRVYQTDTQNDIIVYTPAPQDIYALIGDIVHRTYLVLSVEGKKYYLTQGDNNPLLDVQTYAYGYYERGNAPPAQEQVKGKVLFRIPWLGYFKLFISGLFQEDAQCGEQLVR